MKVILYLIKDINQYILSIIIYIRHSSFWYTIIYTTILHFKIFIHSYIR